jgi:L-ascorbate metabolism protein UlaG (beta-lactamase superfamily)
LKITWYTTAALRLQTQGADLLFDPFVPLLGATSDVTEKEYANHDAILVTHGHFDHLGTVARVLSKGNRVYCTQTPARRLLAQGTDPGFIIPIKPGDRIQIGDTEVIVHRGKHIEFDRRLVRETLFSARVLRYWHNASMLAKQRKNYPENGETVVFEVQAQGKTVLIFGSLDWVQGYTYPKRPDLLVVPYQGNSDLFTSAMKLCALTKPKAVLLDHFDDSFPPLTRTIATERFQNAMHERFCDCKVLKPHPLETIEV